jgi:hypothetical protein
MDGYASETYGQFIGHFPWQWYCTLTFRREVSRRAAFKLFNRWKVLLKKASRQPTDYLLVIEPTRSRNGVPHLHVLLRGVGCEKPHIWQKRWFTIGGQAKVREYDPALGAANYLANKMDRHGVDVLFSRTLAASLQMNSAISKEDPVILLP